MHGRGTKWHRNIVQRFNRLSKGHELHRRQTDGFKTAYTERDLSVKSIHSECLILTRVVNLISVNIWNKTES